LGMPAAIAGTLRSMSHIAAAFPVALGHPRWCPGHGGGAGKSDSATLYWLSQFLANVVIESSKRTKEGSEIGEQDNAIRDGRSPEQRGAGRRGSWQS
jgi:hypothetical protein